MDAFLHNISHYPGVVPTFVIGVLMAFWALAILGMLDFENFGPDWLGGGDLEFDTDAEGNSVPDVLVALGLDRLPFSIVVSAVAFFWWLFTMLVNQWLGWLPLPGWLLGSLILLGCGLLALPVAARALRPLRPVFAVHEGKTRVDLVGRRCKVLTLRVDENFGQIRVELPEGTDYTLKAWARTPNDLSKGSSALILSYDEQSDRYEIEGWDGETLSSVG